MATFAKQIFSASTYATFRPAFPASIFRSIINYHHGPTNHALDLGCGHGVSTRAIAPYFHHVTGIDPSASMVAQARSSTAETNISFRPTPAEDLHFLPDGSVDLVIATQAAHWFDFTVLWPLLSRKVRAGGTIALLGYAENIFVAHPGATRVMRRYCYDDNVPEKDGIDGMGGCWEQPGRDRLRDLYRGIVPPEENWGDVKRWEYSPVLLGEGESAESRSEKEMENGVSENEGEYADGERIMYTTMTLGELEGYIRTFSAYYRWLEAHPGSVSKAKGGQGDVVDEVMQALLEAEPKWKAKGDKWRDVSVETEWGSVVLLARRK